MNRVKIIFEDRKYFFLIWLSLLILPILAGIGYRYYNDDFHFIESIQTYGVFGSILTWIGEYGIIYRPLGITILYVLFGMFGNFPLSLYFISIGLHLIIGIGVYISVSKIFGSNRLGLFTSIFVLFFPLNATGYLQMSSIPMSVALIGFLILLYKINQWSIKSKSIDTWKISLLWAINLLIYEQIVGLVLLLCALIFYRSNSNKFKIVSISSLLMVTMIYMGLYLYNPSNPKVVSIERVSNTVELAESNFENIKKLNIEEAGSLGSVAQIDNKIEEDIIEGRTGQIIYKVKKTNLLLMRLMGSGIQWLLSSSFWVVLFFMLLIGGFSTLAHMLVNTGNVQHKFSNQKIFLFGFLWFILSVAPFFLYNPIKIPVYCFLIPSVGASIFLYVIFKIILIRPFPNFCKFIYSIVVSIVISIFSLCQYGYSSALITELNFWEKVHKNFLFHESTLPMGSEVVLLELPNKGNEYIFWMEKAISTRYINQLSEKKVHFSTDLNIDSNGNVFVDKYSPRKIDILNSFIYKWSENKFYPVDEIIVDNFRYQLKKNEKPENEKNNLELLSKKSN